MSEFMDVINAFGTPLKLAWVGWIAWGVGQYFWFRHERSLPSLSRTAAAAKPAAVKKPAVPKPIAAQAAEAPVVGRLITPTHVAADAKPAAPAAGAPVAPVAPAVHTAAATPVAVAADAPSFDPSTAVIEQFGVTDSALDKFVRDFEMQDARPLRRRTRSTEPPSYGAEAPSAP
jgi:hypothetical protein